MRPRTKQLQILDYRALARLRKKSYDFDRLFYSYSLYVTRKTLLKHLTKKILKYFTQYLQKKGRFIDLHQVRSVLLIKYGHLGDKILFEPVLRTLKKNFPNIKISLLTNHPFKELFIRSPYIDEIHIFNHSKSTKLGEPKDNLFSFLKLTSEIHRRRYDLIIDFKGQLWSSIMTLFFSSKYKVGYLNPITRIFYDLSIVDNHDNHDIFRNLKLLQVLGLKIGNPLPTYTLSKEDILFRNTFLHKYNLSLDDPIIGIHLGSGWGPRSYPLHYLAETINSLHHKRTILIFSGSSEKNLLLQLKKQLKRPVIFAETHTLFQLASLISICSLFLGNDSGPVHLSQVLGISTIILFSSGDYLRWGIFRKNSLVLRSALPCSPCSIEGISPAPTSDTHCIRGFTTCPILTTLLPKYLVTIIEDKLK